MAEPSTEQLHDQFLERQGRRLAGQREGFRQLKAGAIDLSEADRAELFRVHRKDAAQLRELADLTTEIVAYLEGIEASKDKEVQG
jgi:hypothetical protein